MTIKECRERANLSIKTIATKLGMAVREYEQYEKHPDTIPISVAVLFSQIVKIPYDNIFFNSHSI